MKIYRTKDEVKSAVEALKLDYKTIGFVPTMGALHQGHISLIDKALNENDVVVVSIFVNPTQFDNPTDLKNYPRTLDRDVELLTDYKEKVLVYAPTVEDIYGNSITSKHFDFGGIEHEMEGKFRAGHFDGVGTVVKRLLEIVIPDRAYFGKKDFQQLRIIQKLVEIEQLPVKIIGCEIYREADGLAMSSRNERLKPEYRKAAPFIHEILQQAREFFKTESLSHINAWVENQFKNHPLLKLEYFLIADTETLRPAISKSKQKNYRAFIAVYADDIRLIDNIALDY